MPAFKKCRCGFDPKGAEIKPNPLGEYYCPVCGQRLVSAQSKKGNPPSED